MYLIRGATFHTIRVVKKYIYILASFISAAALLGSPVMVWATTPQDLASPLAPLLITEVQVGSRDSASQEFVELFNTSDAAIDFSAYPWQLQIASSSAKDWSSPLRTITLTGIVQPHAYYVAASQYSSGGQTVRYLASTAAVRFSAGMSAAAGHVRLVYTTSQPQSDGSCTPQQTVVDEVEWSLSQDDMPITPSLDGRPPFLESKTAGIPPGNSLQRYVSGTTGAYVDSDDDAVDFGGYSSAPTPGVVTALTSDADGTPQAASPMPTDACVVASPNTGTGSDSDPPADGTGDDSGSSNPTDPAANSGLLAPQLSEVLPNPASPQTDEADEFIEIYNPNDAAFDLSGYMLTAGTATTHSYTFPDGTALAAGAFTSFYSADTGLSLSNSGGQVELLDPDGTVLSRSDAYSAAKNGQSWALIDGTWQWTTAPTPNAVNTATPDVASAPAVKSATAKAPAAKKTATAKAATTKAKNAAAKKPKKAAAKTTKTSTFAASATDSKSPLHPAILATVVLLAVLYGAYEYRQDMANYVRRFRDNRAHRRKNRPQLARRRDD
jgi:hypothetical protein